MRTGCPTDPCCPVPIGHSGRSGPPPHAAGAGRSSAAAATPTPAVTTTQPRCSAKVTRASNRRVKLKPPAQFWQQEKHYGSVDSESCTDLPVCGNEPSSLCLQLPLQIGGGRAVGGASRKFKFQIPNFLLLPLALGALGVDILLHLGQFGVDLLQLCTKLQEDAEKNVQDSFPPCSALDFFVRDNPP